jgi:hypothetical protein
MFAAVALLRSSFARGRRRLLPHRFLALLALLRWFVMALRFSSFRAFYRSLALDILLRALP